MKAGIPIIIALIIFGCRSEETSKVKEIIGDKDFVPIDANGSNLDPSIEKSIIKSIGRITRDNGDNTVSRCTATHIGDGVVVTAGHCFWAQSDFTVGGSCEEFTVEWGLFQDQKPQMVSSCTEILLARDDDQEHDIAMFTVSPFPTSKISIASEVDWSEELDLMIFAHPKGRPMEVASQCVTHDLKFDTLGTIADTLQPMNRDIRFGHSCDTESGSSGAAVLDRYTGELIGVHSGGNKKGNYGTKFDSVLDYIERNDL